MSWSSISKAQLQEGAPRQISLRTFGQKTASFDTELESETQSLFDVQRQLESLREEIDRQTLQMEEDRVRFQDSLEQERSQFEETLMEERKRALESGFSEGFEQGERSGLEAWQAKLKHANAITEKAREERETYIEQSESVILSLAVKVAEKVIGQTLLTDQTAWPSLVKQAIIEMRGNSPIKILVAPSQYDLTVGSLDDLKKSAHGSELLVFVDEGLVEGECKVESPSGILDASVKTQLRKLEDAMASLLESSQ